MRLKNGAAQAELIKEQKMPTKFFSIDEENNITVHASKQDASAVANAVMFSTDRQFADLVGIDGKRLIEVWNTLPGVTPVKKFTSRAIAIERIWKALQSLTCPEKAGGPAIPASVRAQVADLATASAKGTEDAMPQPERASTPANANSGKVREGSKTATVLEMIRKSGGATLQEIAMATGWQAHSVRGFLSGTVSKRMGLNVERAKRADGTYAYQVRQ